MGRVSPCSSNASIATAMLTTSFSRRLGATAFLCRSIYTYRKGTILTSATLEPQAISESSNHNMNRAASTNFPPPAYDAAKSAAIDAIVDASEIEVDPLTHLPFLKNVHFKRFQYLRWAEETPQHGWLQDPPLRCRPRPFRLHCKVRTSSPPPPPAQARRLAF
jgi:hypothetical protein